MLGRGVCTGASSFTVRAQAAGPARNIQLQNLPQNKMADLEQARFLVRAGDYDSVRLLYDSTPDVLSS